MSRLVKCCKRTIRDLGKFADQFENVTPDEIVRSCWQLRTSRVSLSFLLYRWIQFFLHVLFEILSLFDLWRRYSPKFVVDVSIKRTAKYYMKWLLYLTHWGLVLNSVQAFIGVWLVQRAYDAQNRSSLTTNTNTLPPCDILTKVYCYLWSVAFHLATYITLGFWLLIFDPASCGIDAVTLSQHGFGLTLLLMDLFVSGIPYKMFAGICTILLSLFYLLVTYIHHIFNALDRFQDKPFIYAKGDWSQPEAVIIYYVFSVFVMTSFHFSLWGLYLLKRRVILAFRTPSTGSLSSLSSQASNPRH